MINVDLSKFAATPTTKAAKAGPDITRFNQVINQVDKQGLRLSYDAAKVLAQKFSLLSLSQPTTAVFGLLDRIEAPWAVCRKNGGYDDKAVAKFKNPPEGFLTRPIVQVDKVEAMVAALSEADKGEAPASH